MATLERIRSKSALLVIVIGLALLAFIIGDAITNSRNLFGGGTTAAQAGSSKVETNEIQGRREKMNQLQQMDQIDPQMQDMYAMQSLLNEKMAIAAAKKAGIQTNSSLLVWTLMEGQTLGHYQAEQLRQMLAEKVPSIDLVDFHTKIWNPKKYNLPLTDQEVQEIQQAWMTIENDNVSETENYIYADLWSGAINANNLDKKVLAEVAGAQNKVNLARGQYENLDDKKYQPSAQEIKDYYESHKGLYHVSVPTKRIGVIAVNVVPSDADKKASKELGVKTEKALQQSDVLSQELKHAGVIANSGSNVAGNLDLQVKAFLMDAENPEGAVAVVMNGDNGFKIVKKGAVTMEVDSIEYSQVAIAKTADKEKVLAALNAGVALDSLQNKMMADSIMVQVQKDQWLALYPKGSEGPLAIEADILSQLKDSELGWFELPNQGAEGAVLLKSQVVKPAVPVYAYTIATYDLVPSEGTLMEERGKLQAYVEANKNAADFRKNAAKAGYTVESYNINGWTPALPTRADINNFGYEDVRAYGSLLPSSTGVVSWAMRDGKAGSVRENLVENPDTKHPTLYAVAVDEVFDDYVPMSLVEDQIKATLAQRKAGEEASKQYGNKSVAAAASAMKTQPMEMEYSLSSGDEAAIAGFILGTPAGKGTKVATGENGFVVFEVKALGTNPMVQGQDFSQFYKNQYSMENTDKIYHFLRGKKAPKSMFYKFFGRD